MRTGDELELLQKQGKIPEETEEEREKRKMGVFGYQSHEDIGAEYCSKILGLPEKVAACVKYHVPAKRYLCAISANDGDVKGRVLEAGEGEAEADANNDNLAAKIDWENCKNYHDKLSKASQETLKYQGGPFMESEVADFEKIPFYRTAVKCRLMDDRGKSDDAEFVKKVPGFLSYVEEIRGLMKEGGSC
jgi:predicted HD phosphohydrolase